jgi:hypothetical protein
MIFKSKASSKVCPKTQKLDPIRKTLAALVAKANKMVSQLISGGFESSAALQEAYKSANPDMREAFDKGVSDDLFNVSDKHRYRELRREAARLDKFLSSADANIKVASSEETAMNAMARHGLSFGKKGTENAGVQKANLESIGKRFDADEDRVKLAMRVYRQLEDSNTNIYDGQYGSDKLINLIYDSLEGYDPNMSDSLQKNFERHAMEIGQAALTEHRMNTMMGYIEGTPAVNTDVNVIEEIKKHKTTDEFFESNPWLNNF